MNSPIIGILLLLTIIALRWAQVHFKRRRFTHEFQRGSQAYASNDVATAAEAFTKCAKIFPTAAQVHLALGSALARLDRFKEAEEQLRLAAQLEPRQPRGHLELGYFYALCKPDQPDDAVTAFAAAVAYAPALKGDLARDPRLTVLRQHPPFQDLLK